jgi:protein-disulfide isomerase
MFVAGTLVLAKVRGVVPPCGVRFDCASLITGRDSSWWGVPIAFIGFGAYATLATLAIARQRVRVERRRALLLIGLAVAAVGTVISAGLTLYAIGIRHAACLWCLASALIMTASLVVHESLRRSGRVAQASDDPDDRGFHAALTAALILALGMMTLQLDHDSRRMADASGDPAAASRGATITLDSLVAADSHIEGDAGAPVTVVEFGDLTCASCRKYYARVRAGLASHPRTVRFVFHNLPLSMIPAHENAFNAAVLSEMAAERGQFFEYVGRAHALHGEPPDMRAFIQLAGTCGVDVSRWKERALDDKDPAFQRVFADMELARRIGIESVPTYVVCMPGSHPEIEDGLGMSRLLADSTFIAALVRLSPTH